jgi:hypothetical protein
MYMSMVHIVNSTINTTRRMQRKYGGGKIMGIGLRTTMAAAVAGGVPARHMMQTSYECSAQSSQHALWTFTRQSHSVGGYQSFRVIPRHMRHSPIPYRAVPKYCYRLDVGVVYILKLVRE